MIPSVSWPDMKRNLVAILRGIRSDEIEAVGRVLIEEGFEAIEVPLNSPDPFASIEALARTVPANILVGAGTVLSVADVVRLADAGGRLMVSPNVDLSVIAAASEAGIVTMPGVFSPTEALAALRAGASAVKFFPASILGSEGIKAISVILPADAVIGAVGGVSEADFAAYAAAGVRAFGLGSSLYKPGFLPSDVAGRARQAVCAYDRTFSTQSQ